MGKQIKFKLDRMLFYVNDSVVHYNNKVNNKKPYLKLDHLETLSIFVQYIKYLNTLNTIDIKYDFTWDLNINNENAHIIIYLSDVNGDPINNGWYERIKEFSYRLTMGYYSESDKQYIIYKNKYRTENGTELHMSCMYIDILNEPHIGSVPYLINKIKKLIQENKLSLNDIHEILSEEFDSDKVKLAFDRIMQNMTA